eukprot:2156641-Amphidinium_carterae.2
MYLRELKVFTDVDVKSLRQKRGQASLTRDGSFQRDLDQMAIQISKQDVLQEESSVSSVLLAIATQKQWRITATNIQAAFLSAVLGVTEQSRRSIKDAETQQGSLWTQELTNAVAEAPSQGAGRSVQDESVQYAHESIQSVFIEAEARLTIT